MNGPKMDLPPISHVETTIPWMQLGEVDPQLTLTPPPALFPTDSTAQQRAAMRFAVKGNAVCMYSLCKVVPCRNYVTLTLRPGQ